MKLVRACKWRKFARIGFCNMEDSTLKGGTARVRNCKRGTASERSSLSSPRARVGWLVRWTIHAPQSRSSTSSALARQVPLPARPTRALDPRAKARTSARRRRWRWWRPQTSIAAPALGRRSGRAGRPCRRRRPRRWLRPPRLPRLHDVKRVELVDRGLDAQEYGARALGHAWAHFN